MGRRGHGQGGLGQADARDLRQILAASGQQMHLMDVTQGPAGGSGEQGSFPSELVPGRRRGPEGAPCPRRPESRERGRGRHPWRVPLVGWAAAKCWGAPLPGSGQPGVWWQSKSPGFLKQPGGEQEWDGQPFCSSHAGWWSWHFRPKAPVSLGGLWLSPRHLAGGLLSAPRPGQGWEIQQGASACPKDELPWAATRSSPVASPRHGSPLLTQVVWGGVSPAWLDLQKGK